MHDVTGHRVEGHAPEPHPPKGLGEVDFSGGPVVIGALFGAVGVDEGFPEVAVALEVHEPPRASRVQQQLVVGLELLLGPRRAHPQQGDQMRPVDLPRSPRILHRRQGAEGAGVADPLTGRLDRQTLLPGQPRRTGLGTTVVPDPVGVPPGQHACLAGFELTAQALQLQQRVG